MADQTRNSYNRIDLNDQFDESCLRKFVIYPLILTFVFFYRDIAWICNEIMLTMMKTFHRIIFTFFLGAPRIHPYGWRRASNDQYSNIDTNDHQPIDRIEQQQIVICSLIFIFICIEIYMKNRRFNKTDKSKM